MHVLIEDRVVSEARPHLRQLLSGVPLTWDAAPMTYEPWKAYAGVSSGIAQVVRLFGKEVGFDQWGESRRLTLTTLSWEPLPYDFGWCLTCRPFGGVVFQQSPAEGLSPLLGLRYLNSWPHGYLLHDEMARHVPMLRERLLEQLCQLQALAEDDSPELTRDEIEAALLQADKLSASTFVDLFGLGDEDELQGWQMRRSLALLSAAEAAMKRNRDLVCLGF